MPLIAIEGIDGSGKGTQAGRLADSLRRRGLTVQLLSFPRYTETYFGRRIGDFLNGRFGPLDAVSPFLAALLFAGDRYESRGLLESAVAQHDVVILDRYVASNVAHQGAKGAPEERDDLIDWIETVEFDLYRLPRPHLVVLLDLPVSTAQELILRKQPRSYTDHAADLQEADAGYLSRVRELYLTLASRQPEWRIVPVVSDAGLRSIDDVAAEMLAIAVQFL